MKKIILVFVLLVCGILPVSAQQHLREGQVNLPKFKGRTESRSRRSPRPVVGQPIDYECDTICCTRTKKQFGWFAPLDTISQETANHRVVYYRFTQKTRAGHWGRLECLNSYGHYATGVMSPYILKLSSADSDSGANSAWIDKVKTVCMVEFVSDNSGEQVIQERAYDEKGNIVYTFSRVPVSNNQYICSYNDGSGFPAEMRTEDASAGYTYGTLVKITVDRWGNDSTIVFIDAKGKPKANADGVAMEVYIYDESGHLLKQQSRDMRGNLVRDNWGNCGIEYVWNSRHENVSSTYMNASWKPMRMPANRDVDEEEGVIRVNYKYDNYRRVEEEFFTDENGNPMENAHGTHRIVFTYNDRGNQTKITGYNKKGDLSSIGKSRTAIYVYDYDQDGRLVSAVFLDKNGNPVSTSGYLSRIIRQYDLEGNEILSERYYVKDGKEVLFDANACYGDHRIWRYYDGSFQIDSLDHKDRIVFSGHYDANGHLEMVGGSAVTRHSYTDTEGHCREVSTEYDTNNRLVDNDGYCKIIQLSDSLLWTRTQWRYDSIGRLIEVYIHHYDEGFDNLLWQEDANAFGIQTRSGGSSGVRYYKGMIVYNQNGEFASLVGKDEFNEADYIIASNNVYYYSKLLPNGGTKYYDENNAEVTNARRLMDQLPKVMSIEVTDSSAYAKGLRDNDVILQYGKYCVNLDDIDSYFNFRKEWSIRSILDAEDVKRMVVFRITNPERNEYGLVVINNLLGTPSEIGFIPHIRFLTKIQKERILSVIERDRANESSRLITIPSSNTPVEGGKYVIVAFTNMFREVRDKPYALQVGDPAFLLGACIKDREMYWDLTEGENTSTFEAMLSSRKEALATYPTMHYYLTRDMKHVTPLVLTMDAVYTNWFDARISDEDYNRLLKLTETVQKEMNAIRKERSDIEEKHLYATWNLSHLSLGSFVPSGSITFKRKGTCSGTLSNYGHVTIENLDVIYEVTTDYSGTWQKEGNMIHITPSRENNYTVRCIDVPGINEDSKERLLSFFNEECADNPDKILKELSYDYPHLGNEFMIRSLSKEQMVVESSNPEGITFVRK